MAGNIYGLDLGTYEIKIFEKKKGQIWKEKSVIAVKDKVEILAVGDEAYGMFEKAPDCIEVNFPMQGGVIAQFHDMQVLLEHLLGKGKQPSGGAEYVIAVPTDVTQVERKAFFDLLYHSSLRAKSVSIVERGLADAVGAGADVFHTGGVFVLNMGGGTMELSVVAFGGIVLNRLLKLGGEQFDQSVIQLVRRSHDFLIGRKTAERLRCEFGIFSEENEATSKIAGKNLLRGLPQRIDIPISLVRAAMKDPMDECVDAVQSLLERTPPDIRREIEKNGICLTGGMANMKGLKGYLEESTGLKVVVPDKPELCSMYGLRQIILNRKEYARLTYSMLDKDNRWLR